MQKRVIFALLAIAVVIGLGWWLSREPATVGRGALEASARKPRAPRPTHIRRAARGRDAGSFRAVAPSATAPVVAASAGSGAAKKEPGRSQQLHTTVLQQAVKSDWLTTDERGTPCPSDRVRIVFDVPEDLKKYTKGAYFEPLGPEPNDDSQEVNGLLLCEGSSFLYLGFEAYYRPDRAQWDVFPFPEIE